MFPGPPATLPGAADPHVEVGCSRERLLDAFVLDIEPDRKTRLHSQGRNDDMVMGNGVGLLHDKTVPLKENGKPALQKTGYDFKAPRCVSFA